MAGNRPPPVDIGGIDKRRAGGGGSSKPGAKGDKGDKGDPGGRGPQGLPGEPYWSPTAPDPALHPVWGHSVELVIYNWVAGSGWINAAAPTADGSVEAHEAAPDPHPQYLSQAEADLLYEPLGGGGGGGSYTDEQAQDAVAAAFAAATMVGATVTYDDAGNKIGIATDPAPPTHAATGKTTPVDADELPVADSAASWVLKKLTWANIKTTLKAYFDTLYAPAGFGTYTVGTSNPGGTPTNGQLHFRSDLGLFIFYSSAASAWLTCQEWPIGAAMTSSAALTTTGQVMFRAPVESIYQMYLTRLVFSTFVQTTNNASNYWTVRVERYDSSNTPTTITPVTPLDTSANAINGWYKKAGYINAALDASAQELTISGLKTLGNPGALSYAGHVYYRLIIT